MTPTPSSMSDFVSALSSAMTSSAMWSALTTVAPLVATIVLFAFGYHILRRTVAGASHGKAEM